jgi:hypothetical protein
MASTYTPIATTTLANSTTSDVSFTSISGSYTDLIVVVSGAGTYAATDVLIQTYVNNDYSGGYSTTWLRGDGSSATSGRQGATSGAYVGYLPATLAAAGSIGNLIINYQNYSNSTTYKTILSRTNAATSKVQASVAMRSNTSAITQINVATFGVGYFTSGTTFTLYGIKAA